MNDRASRPPSNTSAQNSQFKRPKSKIDVASIVNKVEEQPIPQTKSFKNPKLNNYLDLNIETKSFNLPSYSY